MLADAPHLGYGELDSRRERHGINRLRDPIQGEVFKLAEAEIQVAEIQRSYKPLDMRLVVRRSRGFRVRTSAT